MLPFFIDVDQVLIDGPYVLLEQVRNQCLRQPNRLVLKRALNPRPAILGLVQELFRILAIRQPLALPLDVPAVSASPLSVYCNEAVLTSEDWANELTTR